ncbi:hypothetical protein BKI52_24045 [marine bacterium AO1-C]|nr:hypothetical protein BKI52_24045 [marine bacterium AO1-C]
MQKHLKQIGIPSLIALLFIIVDIFIEKYTLMHFSKWGLLAFFVLSSLLTTFITSYGMKANPDGFHKYYFTSIGVRFFLSIIFVFICIFLRIEGRNLFVINFFVFYFLYFVFEIYFLLGNLRAKSETSE